MKKIYFFLVMLGVCSAAYGQQDAQYTQFMFNKLSLNPGYVVATDYACVSCLHRSQWVGFEGAPTSQSANFRMPLRNRNVGLGLSLNSDKLGPTSSFDASLIYGYRIDFEKGSLGVGLKGTIRNHKIDWDKAETLESGDGVTGANVTAENNFNAGLGLYYYAPKYYVGISVPRLINNDISQIDSPVATTNDFSKEEFHAFLMAGVLFDMNDNIKLKPALLFKYSKNAPLDLDLNVNVIFFEKLWTGITYRFGGFDEGDLGESIDFILQYQISNPIKIGVAYDYTLSKVRNYNSGTYELMLEYCFSPQGNKINNPRFF
jgi:type IX secretion system PorP/SprF family membrane protein